MSDMQMLKLRFDGTAFFGTTVEFLCINKPDSPQITTPKEPEKGKSFNKKQDK